MAQLEIFFKNATFCQESIALDEAVVKSQEIEKNEAENVENSFAPTTFVSFPILTRAVAVNDKAREESDDIVKSDLVDKSAEPEYNWSTKFEYNHIQQLMNDLLLSDSTNCNIFLQDAESQKKGKKKTNDQNEIFGIINMQWKEWLLAAINDKDCEKWKVCLPILDPNNHDLKKGELNLDIRFYLKREQIDQDNENADDDDAKKNDLWQICEDFIDLIPSKYSFLTISGKDIKSIPSDWYSNADDDAQVSISMAFEVNCSKDYSEKIEVDFPLQPNESKESVNDLLLDKEWIFFVDEHGLNYYLNKAQNKESFDIQFQHIIATQDKKKGIIKTMQHQSCLSLDLRSFTRPGTCSLVQAAHIVKWIADKNDTESAEDAVVSVPSSHLQLEFGLTNPLIEPYIKPVPSARELSNTSQLLKEHKLSIQNQTKIESTTKFQAIIASIQEELKAKYLKICTNYDDMTKEERKTAFVTYILSSTHGQKLTDSISQIIAEVAKEEMHKNPNLIKQQLTITLRAKLEEILTPVFDQVTNQTQSNQRETFKTDEVEDHKKSMESYLKSKGTENVFAEPLRDIDTILTLIEIALLNQDYKAAHKWITQAMLICDDQSLYGSLYMKLAFVLSQNERISEAVSPYHCIQHSLSNEECKESLFAKVLMLCEQDKLEEAEPSMNTLLASFPNDPFVEILHGLFENLMEETEDAQSIWQKQSDFIIEQKKKRIDEENKMRNEDEEKAEIEDEDDEELEYEVHEVAEDQNEQKESYSLYDLWIYLIQMALKFGCQQMIEIILKVSKPFFEETNEAKIDFVLMQHHCLVYNKEYEMALKELAEAILLNDKDTRIWLHIGSTYSLLDRQSEAIEALERHINECHDQQILPNLMGIFKLVQIFLSVDDEEHNKNYKTALALIEICWDRIEKDEIFSDDQLNILVSFEDRNHTFIQAIKYKLFCIQAGYFDKVGDTTSSLSHYAVKFCLLLM